MFYLYTGSRVATGCKLKVNDFHQEGDEAMIRFHLKGVLVHLIAHPQSVKAAPFSAHRVAAWPISEDERPDWRPGEQAC
jgi:hypothetical protein